MVNFEIKRNLTPQNIAEITELLDTIEKADNRRPLNDHLWIDLRQGGRPGFSGLTARDNATGKPVAYCQISRGNDSWAINLVVHPSHRQNFLAIGKSLLGEATKIISDQGGGHVLWWVSGARQEHETLANLFDLHLGRTLLQMRIQLPLSNSVISATTQVAIQSFRVGIDEDAWLALNNRAFLDHPEQGNWTKQILQSRQAEKWFDSRGFLLCFAEDSSKPDGPNLAAFCWTKIDQDPAIGEIYVIAVDPKYQGRGLGRSLTVAGLEFLTAQGATTGMLFVDKDNVAAVSTYKKLGFEVCDQEQAFVGDLAPRGE